ncbi:AlbA family DNA-binding domain-containing protein [Faecalibacterium intestinale]|uniref:Uncharacterized protein n=1 Tax=Faecalibacterium intestinale TaxID=3133155 RepID=A0ABV1C561_9FIRM
MTEQALRKMITAGESTRQEFKSWVKCKDYRQRKDLAVKSAIALANTKGGYCRSELHQSSGNLQSEV